MAAPVQPGDELFGAQVDEVLRSPVEQTCIECALVLRAVGIRCAIRSDADGHALFVSHHDAAKAQAELEAYTRENRDAPAHPIDLTPRTDGWASVLVYASVVLLVAICADRQALGHDWFAAGKAGAGLIREGAWWRTITALTLHVDRAHLIANLVIGGLFGLFAARLLGSGLAWFSILLGGAMGNALNAWLRPADHTSVGASTAIFAALGIVSGWAWTQGRGPRRSFLARWTPVIGGVVLLGYLGGGGDRTDVGAHVAGFVSGLLLGAICGKLGVRARIKHAGQALLALGALILLVVGWTLALSANSGKG